jgi:homoserine O-acetyltransferase
MDTHDITASKGRYPGDLRQTLAVIDCSVLVMGMNSDILYPISEQQELVNHLSKGRLVEIDTIHGHDGFLLEVEQVGSHLRSFLLEII